MINKLRLKILYIQSLINQKISRDGSFPFEDYKILKKYVKNNSEFKILECGTGIGLSSSAMITYAPKSHIITIEKSHSNADIARVKIKEFDKYNNVEVICSTYFKYLNENKDLRFDLIFLDAYVTRIRDVKFLLEYLKSDGVFIVSNLRSDLDKSLQAINHISNPYRFKLLEKIKDTYIIKRI